MTNVTDPWGTQVGYTYDSTGRLASVTGSGTGSAPTYASNFQYRAFDAVKGITYGNGVELSVGYTNRLQPNNYRLTSPNTQNPTPLDIDYNYTAEGLLRNSTDHQDGTLDRAYHVDHAGQLVEAFTGSEARTWVQTGGASFGTAVDGPYRQAYTLDVWSNLTSKFGRSFTGTYLRQQTVNYTYDPATNRNTGWSYDANGNTTYAGGVFSTFDAAGRLREASNYASIMAQMEFDGDGNRVKKTSDFDEGYPTQTYYLYSTVLEQDLAEIASDGTRTNGFVYADDELVATQASGMVFWQHRDPSNRSRRTIDSTGVVVGKSELDPMDVTLDDPRQPPHYGGGSGGGGKDAGGAEARIASLMDLRMCDFGGMLVPCGLVNQYAQLIHESGPLQESLWYSPTGAFQFVVTPARKPPQLKPQPKKRPSKKEIERRKKQNAGVGKDELDAASLAPNGLASNTRLSDEDCDKKLSAIFGGVAFAMVSSDLAVKGGRGNYGHSAVARNDLPKSYIGSDGKPYRNTDRGGIIHTYTDGNGSARTDVGLYTPAGWSGTPVNYYSGLNSGLRFNYSTGLTISFVHVGTFNDSKIPSIPSRNSSDKNTLGSVRIGYVGGFGGEGDNYHHTHIIFYSDFATDTRIDPRRIVCGF